MTTDLLADTKAVILWLLGVIVGLLTWSGKRLYSKVEDLEKTAVTKEHFERTIQQMRDDRATMHAENRETARESREMLGRIHDRVDDLWKSNHSR